MTPRPRRRVLFEAKIGADTWRDLQSHLHSLATQIACEGSLSTCSISGGYSSGHIINCNEDTTIDHDSWAEANEAYVAGLKAGE